MQLRRAVPLSLFALLATAGCVSVGPQDVAPVPARGSVPPPDATAPDLPPPLPLGTLPPPAADPAGAGADQAAARPPDTAPRPAKPAAPARRPRAAKPAAPHSRRQPAPPPRMDELCAAAEGTVPPSVVDLCLRQYGR
ncbi:hypothetical protein [Streptomyces sp. CB00455]|uniref:hypothetical protein n=1 Tax=Streptomyces sp. CB00455 TaxID=1703927 RepID=UPI0009396C2D|nr:hypothetical protein [Streptomyces sp. CB00455]